MHGGFDYDAISDSFFLAVGTPEKVVESDRANGPARMGTNHFNSVHARCRHAALEGR